MVDQALVPAKGDVLLRHHVPQLREHQAGDGTEVFFTELVEADHFIHPVNKLRPQEFVQGLHGPLPAHIAEAAAKAHAAGLVVAAGVGGHDDDGILKVHGAALGVGNAAVVQNLQQDVHHVRVGLLDLVKEHHTVGLAADLLRQLAGLVIAHIARGRTDDAGDGELLHKLRHIQPDQGLRGIEHIRRQALDQFGLANAGTAHEDEAHRLAVGFQPHPAALDGGADGRDRLILAHDMLLQPAFQPGQMLQLILTDAGGGNLGPQLDDPGQVIQPQLRHRLCVQFFQLLLQLQLLAAQLGNAGVALIQQLLGHLHALGGFGGHETLPLKADVLQVPLGHHALIDVFILQVHIGAGLVDQVDGLIRQEAVGNIPLAEQHGLAAHLLRDANAVMLLIIMGDALDDLHAVLNGGLIHRHRLEAPLQSGVLLDMLAVLGEGGSADDLDLPTGEGGLEDVGGVHAALGIPGTHDVMHLVNDQDDVAQLADLLNEALHAAFKLAPELGARHQGGQVQQKDLLILQLIGHVAHGDALGQALGDGGFAHAGLADQAGIVLLPPVQDLDHPLQLLLPADHIVQLSLPGPLGQVDAITVQELPLGSLGILLGLRPAGRVSIAAAVIPGIAAAEQAVEEGEGGGLAVVLDAVVPFFHGHQALQAGHGGAEVAGETVQVVVTDAHFVDHVVNGLYVQFPGALEAQTLVLGLARFYFGNEYNRHVFTAAGTHCRLHGLPPL